MPSLSEYANVQHTAVAVLRAKGFQVWRDGAAEMYCAERGGWDFMASTPVALLGLLAIYEAQNPAAYAEYWWRDSRAQGLLETLPTSPTPYVSVIHRK